MYHSRKATDMPSCIGKKASSIFFLLVQRLTAYKCMFYWNLVMGVCSIRISYTKHLIVGVNINICRVTDTMSSVRRNVKGFSSHKISQFFCRPVNNSVFLCIKHGLLFPSQHFRTNL